MFESRHQTALLDTARDAILAALEPQSETCAAAPQGESALLEPGASFVTLTMGGRLRGCIGSIIATRPLIEDVWHNAQQSAFADPRFAPLSADDATAVHLEISVLGPLEPMAFESETELLALLRPNQDGLLIRFRQRRATYLPKVWESLPQPREYMRSLKQKMGLPADFWHPAIEAQRYSTETFAGPLVTPARAASPEPL